MWGDKGISIHLCQHQYEYLTTYIRINYINTWTKGMFTISKAYSMHMLSNTFTGGQTQSRRDGP